MNRNDGVHLYVQNVNHDGMMPPLLKRTMKKIISTNIYQRTNEISAFKVYNNKTLEFRNKKE